MTLVSTAARASSASGGLATLFDSGTLGANAASIDTGANGIAQTSSHLLICVMARSTTVAGLDTFAITWNNDASASYAYVGASARTAWSLGSPVALGTPPSLFQTTAASSVAGDFGMMQLRVNRYTDATPHVLTYDGGFPFDHTNYQYLAGMLYYGAATAISRMKINYAAGQILAGSRLTIFGF